MKIILSVLLLIASVEVHASSYRPILDNYITPSISYPSETSTQGLPEAIPCTTRTDNFNNTILKCTWLELSREVAIWDDKRKMDVRYLNQNVGTCLRGKCRSQSTVVGEYDQDVKFRLSIWYVIGTSTDGKPVAYRHGATRMVSYKEAGQMLHQFYLDIGVPDRLIEATLDGRYDGGYAALVSNVAPVKQEVTQGEWPEIKEAWCNPRMDDECYIDGERVPMHELNKYLPEVSQSNIDQIGGYCEGVICFDADNVPVGVMYY